jgi:hypothetical protein
MTESSDDARPHSGPARDRPARSGQRKVGRRRRRPAGPPTRRLRRVSAELTGVNAFAPV